MINTIYVENEIKDHSRTLSILSKFKRSRIIYINKYSEIFNKKKQSFRLQKKDPLLILAKKYNNLVLKAPEGFGIGASKNYYFSHMYNCIYDCKYCFLQGLYSSANYLVFVNYEDFLNQIKNLVTRNKSKSITFFSGYDCDSLAMEKVTSFADFFLKNYLENKNITYEFRTKSLQINPFLKNKPSENIIIAYSLLPGDLAQKFDIKAPAINLRIKSLKQLTSLGWKIGLRFDPLIYNNNWKISYKELISTILDEINTNYLHSVSFGSLRFPKQIFNTISTMYPGDELFSHNFKKRDNVYSYKDEVEKEMSSYCKNLIYKKVKKDVQIFTCTPY